MCWFYTCYFTFHCHIWCRPVSFNLNERLFGFFVSIIAPIHSASHGMSSKWGDFLFPSKEYLIISFRFLKTLYFIPFTDRMKSKLINVVYNGLHMLNPAHFFPSFKRYNWQKLYMFKVYSRMVSYKYTLWNGQHDQAS